MPTEVDRLIVAHTLHMAGRLTEAAAIYQDILATNPASPDALQLLGTLYRQNSDTAMALACLQRAIALNPGMSAAYNNLANVYRSCDRAVEAATLYRQALLLEPTMDTASHGLHDVQLFRGWQAWRTGHSADAEALLQQAISILPEAGEGYVRLGLVLHGLRRYPEAAETLYWAMHLLPEYLEVRRYLQDALTRSGRRAEAVAPVKDAALARCAAARQAGENPATLAATLATLPACSLLPKADRSVVLPHFLNETQRLWFFTHFMRRPQYARADAQVLAPEGRLLTIEGGGVIGQPGRLSLLLDAAGRPCMDVYTDDVWLQNGEDLCTLAAAAGQTQAAFRAGQPGGWVNDPRAALVATAPWDWNYYHFLTEAVPRLLFTRQALLETNTSATTTDYPVALTVRPMETGPAAPAVLVAHDRSFQRDILSLLGIPATQWVAPGPIYHRFARWHYLHTFQNTMALRTESAAILRHFLWPAAGVQTAGPPPTRRLYISRADSTRTIVNEDTLYARLAPLGFERIVCSALSVAEQIRTFAEAAVVVGAHGANLSNTVFMRQGLLVELMGKEYLTQPYWVIARATGVEYALILCDDVDTDNPDCRNRDMQVPVDDVEEMLTRYGIRSGT